MQSPERDTSLRCALVAGVSIELLPVPWTPR
jgi:hypothetical protein